MNLVDSNHIVKSLVVAVAEDRFVNRTIECVVDDAFVRENVWIEMDAGFENESKSELKCAKLLRTINT